VGYSNGTYTRNHNFSADASAGIKILAARQDTEWDDLASALTNVVWTRDGNTVPTADIPMGGRKFTNVGSPSSALNMMRSKDFIENVPIYMVDAEASADRISVSASFYTTASAATAPRDGSHILIKAGSDKSSAVAVRLNTGDGSPHSAGVVLSNGSAIYSGAIRSGGIYEFIWSSSDVAWQIMNPQVDYAASAYPGVILLATAAEVAAGTDVPKAVTPAQLADKFSAQYATATSAGLVELATTAEMAAGTNVSAVITPSVLHSYASAANTTSAGLIEIATTAEGSTGTDTARAITPAVLKAVISPSTPYLMVLAVNSAGTQSIISQNAAASAWSFSSANGVSPMVRHNLALSSAGALVVSLQIRRTSAPASVAAAILTSVASAGSTFAFSLVDFSASAVSFRSCNIHMISHRIS
jgi:hypothetical protein